MLDQENGQSCPLLEGLFDPADMIVRAPAWRPWTPELRIPLNALTLRAPMHHKTSSARICAVVPSFCTTLLTTALALQSITGGAATKPSFRQVADGFVCPVSLVPFPDKSGRVLIVDQAGTAHLHVRGKEPKVFLDVRPRLAKFNEGFDEKGLLDVVLHPGFLQNRKLYAFYGAPLRASAPQGFSHTSRLSEFKVSESDPEAVDLASERVLLEIDKPQWNHNGGRMVFGPDGFLYIGTGDGGNGNDSGPGHGERGNGQNTEVLLGKILRIDVDHGDPYGIPQDNPFAKGGGRPEIFAYGIRNPWGLSFDRGGQREFFVADVGQDAFEELNIIVKGGNYGWNRREGFSCFDPKNPTNPPDDCPKVGDRGEPLIDPILAYKNSKRFSKDGEGLSIIGGYVYRGSALPALQGRYIFADWSRAWQKPEGQMFVASRPADGKGPWTKAPLDLESHPGGLLPGYIVSFGENAEGELYVMTTENNELRGRTGRLFKLVP